MTKASLNDLQAKIGYIFVEPKLLRQALTHRSYASMHYERLEFLGDGVLNFVIAHCLYQRFSGIKEGELSRVRAHLVKQDALESIARRLNISDYLFLGEGELRSGGLERPSILADVVEAIFGAIFLDAGFGAVQKVIVALYQPLFDDLDPNKAGKDPKTQLQERLQAMKIAVPKYDIIETTGAAHEQVFTVSCLIETLRIQTEGTGSTRRLAEQNAARAAMLVMDDQPQKPVKKLK